MTEKIDGLDEGLDEGFNYFALYDKITKLHLTALDEIIDLQDTILNVECSQVEKEALVSNLNYLTKQRLGVIAKNSVKMNSKKHEIMMNSEYLDKHFIAEIEAGKHFDVLKTGIDGLDKNLDGVSAELVILGAVTGAGKTSLMLQIADNMALSGQNVLIFSLEQSRKELICKSIARVHNQKTRKTITGKQIKKGQFTEEVHKAIGIYKTDISPFSAIVEANFNMDIFTIREIIDNYIDKYGKKPIVFIDYLQSINSKDNNKQDKQRVDEIVIELKRISRDFDIMIWALSSVNRDSYYNPINLKSLKESGSLEFSADIIFGLDYSIAFELGKKSDSEKCKLLDEAKTENPRKVKLTCLKNRSGISGFEVNFDYFPNKEIFQEVKKNYI